MTALAYTRFELVRTARNRALLLLALGFPLLIFVVIGLPNRDELDLAGTGIPPTVYFMVGLVAFGTMSAVMSAGGRIAGERTDGWTRQLSITPLSPVAYLAAKVLTGYAMAAATMALLFGAGLAIGVSLPLSEWATMTGLVLAGLLPFAMLGILLGHLVTADAVGPAVGGLTSLLSFFSGAWFPLSGVMEDVAQVLPSCWLVQASRVSLGGAGWPAGGWLVVAGWTCVLGLGAWWAYRRDTERI